jgi:hypothetical protein
MLESFKNVGYLNFLFVSFVFEASTISNLEAWQKPAREKESKNITGLQTPEDNIFVT